jgi:ribosome-associated toxin RatA of RatAB toxin-antitoxin module
MNKVEATITIRADVRRCFDFVADPANIPRFMAGVTRYEPKGRKDRGKGARFDSVAVVAGRNITTVLEIIDWKDCERMTAVSNGSVKLKASWIFEEYDDDTTDVTLTNEYEAPGVFKLMGGLVRPTVDRGVTQSLARLKRLVEAETRKAGRV